MAVQTKKVLKSYFETGDKPTQEEFADLIDTLQTKAEVEEAIDEALKNVGIEMVANVITEVATLKGQMGEGTVDDRISAAIGLSIPHDCNADFNEDFAI